MPPAKRQRSDAASSSSAAGAANSSSAGAAAAAEQLVEVDFRGLEVPIDMQRFPRPGRRIDETERETQLDRAAIDRLLGGSMISGKKVEPDNALSALVRGHRLPCSFCRQHFEVGGLRYMYAGTGTCQPGKPKWCAPCMAKELGGVYAGETPTKCTVCEMEKLPDEFPTPKLVCAVCGIDPGCSDCAFEYGSICVDCDAVGVGYYECNSCCTSAFGCPQHRAAAARAEGCGDLGDWSGGGSEGEEDEDIALGRYMGWC